MSKWSTKLNADPTDWLLEEDNPSVRYFTLLDILGKRSDNSEVIEAKKQIMRSEPVTKLLSRQKKEGNWFEPENFYSKCKYKGTVWSFIILAELGADGGDKRIRKAADFILTWSQDRESGGFAHKGSAKNGGQRSSVIPCLSGNMVWSMIRFGYFDEPGVKKGLDWLTTYMRYDDGDGTPPKEWPYKNYPNCWGKHTCHMGAIKALKAAAEVPPRRRTKDIKMLIENGSEYFLQHHVHYRSHDTNKLAKPFWTKFSFPLMYQTEALDILMILTKLGYKDKRMQRAVDLVISKQDEEGRWKLERSFNDKTLVRIEKVNHPSKWITLNALRTMKAYYR
jgi:hypothetical protein